MIVDEICTTYINEHISLADNEFNWLEETYSVVAYILTDGNPAHSRALPPKVRRRKIKIHISLKEY